MNSTEPIAVTTGYYGGQATVKALDESIVLPVGLALYPQPAQQGVAYAALPDAPLPVFSKGPWTFKETGQNFSGAELDEAAFVAYRDRAALAASEQAAPAYKDGTPELHIGDSAFESWYSSYSPAHKSDKQRACDAYAAGMGDPLVTAAPAAVAGPSDPSITLDFKQATELLKMFGGEPGRVTLQHGNERSHSGAGLYAWYSDLPEEGAVFLGAEPDD